MSKKVFCFLPVFVFFAAFLSPLLEAQYRAEDITVPPGHEVTKIAETNRAVDPYRLTFDSNGNLIAGSYNYMILAIDPSVVRLTLLYND